MYIMLIFNSLDLKNNQSSGLAISMFNQEQPGHFAVSLIGQAFCCNSSIATYNGTLKAIFCFLIYIDRHIVARQKQHFLPSSIYGLAKGETSISMATNFALRLANQSHCARIYDVASDITKVQKVFCSIDRQRIN